VWEGVYGGGSGCECVGVCIGVWVGVWVGMGVGVGALVIYCVLRYVLIVSEAL